MPSFFCGDYSLPALRPEKLFELHASLGKDIGAQLDVPTAIVLRSLWSRKNMQVSFFSNVLSPWEQAAIQQHNKHSLFEEYFPLYRDITKQKTIPKLEKLYQTPIAHWHLFPPHYQGNYYYSFFLKIFSSPIFKHCQPQMTPQEDQLANALSARLRQQNGRGPSKIQVALTECQLGIFAISGLFPPYSQQFFQSAPESPSALATAAVTYSLVQNSLQSLGQEYYQQPACETFIHVDLSNNLVLALILFLPLYFDQTGQFVFSSSRPTP